MNDRPLLELDSPEQWRAWLEANHASFSGVWLTVAKKGSRRSTLTYDAAVEEALCWGWIDSTVNRLDAERTKQLYTPRHRGSTWAVSNKRRVERLIAEGRMQTAGLAVVEAAKADGSWQLLDDVEALVVPNDLADALANDERAGEGFEGLPDSEKKMALYWIASAKKPETRAKRIAATVSAAAEGHSPF
jgi:uncharacterized protein YdeI (YjbR/CyaY-like superfamily)